MQSITNSSKSKYTKRLRRLMKDISKDTGLSLTKFNCQFIGYRNEIMDTYELRSKNSTVGDAINFILLTLVDLFISIDYPMEGIMEDISKRINIMIAEDNIKEQKAKMLKDREKQ